MEEKLRKAVEDIGGEAGTESGFEEEVPEPGLSDAEPADKTASP